MSTASRARLAGGLRLLADMGLRFRIRSCVLAILLMLTLQPAAPAWAGCNVTDVVNAMKAGVETALICQPVCEDKYRCYGAAGLAIVLTEISRKKGQDKVDSFCSQVQGTLDEILGKLQLIGDLTDNQISELSDTMKGLGDVIAMVNCACKTEQLQLKNEASFGACANYVLEYVGCGEIDWTTATIGGCDPLGGVIADVVDEGLDALMDLGCGWLWDCAGGSADPISVQCGYGRQADSNGVCHPCSEIQHAITHPDGSCGCEPPYTRIHTSIGGRPYLLQCSCDPPNRIVGGQCVCPLGASLVNGVCQCPFGTQVSAEKLSCVNRCDNAAGEVLDVATGKCVACPPNSKTIYVSGSIGHCEACEYGQTVSADRKSCTPACAPGQVMGGLMFGKDPLADPNAYQCQACPDNTYASYENAGGSRGVCLPCADGTFAKAGASQCLPLNCSFNSYQDPYDPHACKSCPPTQIYIPTEKKIVTSLLTGEKGVQVVPGHCGCGENQKLVGDVCVCPTGAINPSGSLAKCACPEGATLDMATFTCGCPEGAAYDKPTGNDRKCVCAKGSRLENGKCVLPGARFLALPKDCSALGPSYINNPRNPAACVRCPAGRIANANRSACVAPARRVTPAIAPPPAGRAPKPSLRCPPGMVPNAAGTACIRKPDVQRVVPPRASSRPLARPPASLRPPARREMPGGPPRLGVPAGRS